MAVAGVPVKGKGPLVDPALCRCCRSIKRCRLLTSEYEWMGNREVYSEMIMDCFGLLLSESEGGERESCICATCVSRLRDALAFRRQVLLCEQSFIDSLQNRDSDHKLLVEVKAEPACDSGSDAARDDGDDAIHAAALIEDTKLETLVDKRLTPDTGRRVRRRTRQREARPAGVRAGRTDDRLEQELLDNMQQFRDKLDLMIDKNESKPVQKKRKSVVKTKKSTLDHDDMVYKNAVAIATNSYVCPFHNRISNYYCYYCKDQFTNPNELREHTLTHDPKEMFESMMENKKIPKIDITRVDCRLCSEKIEDVEVLKSHLSEVHSVVIYPVNNEFLKFRLSLNNLTCTECSSSFPYFDSLKKHMIDHFGTYICDICGACFLEQNSLRTHIKSHSKVEAYFPCEICGKNLKSKYSRYLHVATVHEKKPTVNCYKCEASFLSYALRNRHLIEVHGDKRTFPCKLCDKVYNRRKTLMEHNRRNHLKVYRHQCDLCDQRFYLPSRLKEHMATHTGERNFRCEFCDKSYPRLQSLQEHIRSHSNERRFKCDICNTAFTQNGSLKNHMKSHHQGYDLDASFN